MTTAILNINDAGLQLALDGKLVRTSPGYAVLDNSKLMLGEEAAQHAKLLPRWANNRFWDQLNTSALPNATDQIRHHADLALAHLEHLWQPASHAARDLLICVPGHYSNDSLGLLLALCKAAKIAVRGLVDTSVLAASNLKLASRVLHLDINLHRITLSQLSNEGVLARRSVQTLAEIGLAALRERWANIIAGQFIQATRFDPLHDAVMEQRLFDTLPNWIASLEGEPLTRFDLADNPGDESQGANRSVTLPLDSLLTAVNQLYPRIIQAIRQEAGDSGTVSLLLAPGFAGFPGLRDSLQLIQQLEIIALPQTQIIDAAWAGRNEITPDDGVVHVTRLKSLQQARAPASQQSPNRVSHPTHLLAEHGAWPIGDSFKLEDLLADNLRQAGKATATLHVRSGSLMLEPGDLAVTVNGDAIQGSCKLKIGDRLGLGQIELTLICVQSDALTAEALNHQALDEGSTEPEEGQGDG